MRLENDGDPRRLLCETKYFGMRPQPLEELLFDLQLTRTAERVYWLHWDAGVRRGDWTSEIPISVVAGRCRCDESSVTRAYQLLRKHGLLRRESPGRVPGNPFRECVAVTEVLIPRNMLGKLLAAPARAKAPKPTDRTVLRPSDPSTNANSGHAELEGAISTRYGKRAMEVILAKMTDTERTSWYQANRAAQAGREVATFDVSSESRLDELDTKFLLAFLSRVRTQVIAERPTASTTKAVATGPRLSPFELAYLRKQLGPHVPTYDLDERVREVSWSVEFGALRRFSVRLAINIACKKMREAEWTRPNGMPPNWRLALARTGSCTAA